MKRQTTVLAVLVGLSVVGGAPAGTVTWDGDTSVLFTNSANWVGDVAPANDKVSDLALFSGALTPYLPEVSVDRSVAGIRWDSAGWTLGSTNGGNGNVPLKLSVSNGVAGDAYALNLNAAGRVSVAAQLGLYGTNSCVNVVSGGTLTLQSLLLNAGPAPAMLVKSGDGTLVLGSGLGIAGSGNGSIQLQAGTLKLAGGPSVLGNGTAYYCLRLLSGATLDLNGNGQYMNDSYASPVYYVLEGSGGTVVNSDPYRAAPLCLYVGGTSGHTNIGTFSGQLRGNLSLWWAGNPASLYLDSGNHDFTGWLHVCPGDQAGGLSTLYLRGTAAITAAAGIGISEAHVYGNDPNKLKLDNNTSGNSSDRLGDTIPIYLRGGQLELIGKNSDTSSETIGPVVADFEGGLLVVTPGSSVGTTLSVDSIRRGSSRGILVPTGMGTATSKIKVLNNPPSVVNGMMDAWVLSGRDTSISPMTYNAITGFVAVATYEKTGLSGAGANDKVNATADQALTADTEVYAFRGTKVGGLDITGGSTSSYTLTLGSGCLIMNTSGAGAESVVDAKLKFGHSGEKEGVIAIGNPATTTTTGTLNSAITTTNGMTVIGSSYAFLKLMPVSKGHNPAFVGTEGNWSGQLTMNNCGLRLNAVAGDDANGYLVPGDLVLSGPGAVCTLTADNQISPKAKLTLNNLAQLVVSNQTLAKVTINEYSLSGNYYAANYRESLSVASGATLKLGGDPGYTGPDIVVQALGTAANPPRIAGAGTLDLNGARTIEVGAGFAPWAIGFQIDSFITNSGASQGLTKNGAGLVLLTCLTNRFGGDLIVNGGLLGGYVNASASDTPFGGTNKNLTLNNRGGVLISLKPSSPATAGTAVQTLTAAGGNSVWLRKTAGDYVTCTLSASNFVRSGRATLEIVGMYGDIVGSGTGPEKLLIGNAADRPVNRNMAAPHFVTRDNVYRNAEFVTYGAYGFKQVTYTNVAAGDINNATATTLLRAVRPQTLTAARTVEALSTAFDISGAYTLTVQGNQVSGNTQAGLILNQDLTVGSNLKFGDTGAAEALVYANISKVATVAGTITTTGGLTKFGNGVLSLTADNSSTLSGGIVVNDGALRIGGQAQLGANTVLLHQGTDLQVTNTCTLSNAISGKGRIATLDQVVTIGSSGSLSPGVTASDIGSMIVEDLDFRGTYNWKYNGVANDTIACETLAFGGPWSVNVSWVGGGSATNGTNVLFTYTGAAPSLGTWSVTMPKGKRGNITLDSANKRVLLAITTRPPEGTLIRVR